MLLTRRLRVEPWTELVQPTDNGFHPVLEGILYVAHYGDMIRRLLADYGDRAHCSHLDVASSTLTATVDQVMAAFCDHGSSERG